MATAHAPNSNSEPATPIPDSAATTASMKTTYTAVGPTGRASRRRNQF